MSKDKDLMKRVDELEKQLLRVVDIMSRLASREYRRDIEAFCAAVLPYSGNKLNCTACGGSLVVNGTRRVVHQPGSAFWALAPDDGIDDPRAVLRLVCESCSKTEHMWPKNTNPESFRV